MHCDDDGMATSGQIRYALSNNRLTRCSRYVQGGIANFKITRTPCGAIRYRKPVVLNDEVWQSQHQFGTYQMLACG